MKRTITKLIRFSEEEWKNVQRRAKAAGMKSAVFIRNIADKGQLKFYDLEKFQSLSYPMRGISSSMNQIAKVANSTQSVYEKDVTELRELTEHLREMFDAFFSSQLKYEAV